MFEFLKKGKYEFRSIFVSDGIEVGLFHKDKPIDLTLIEEDNVFYKDFEKISRVVDLIEGIKTDGLLDYLDDLFLAHEIPSKLGGYRFGNLFLSYPLIYSLKFESFLDSFGLPNDSFSFMNIPDFSFLNIKLRFNTKIENKKFRIDIQLLNNLNVNITDYRIENFLVIGIDGNRYFITPEQRNLIKFIEDFNSRSETTINQRVDFLSQLKKMTQNSAVALSDGISGKDYLNVKELKVSLGRNMDGSVIVEPDISPDEKINIVFRNQYENVDRLDLVSLKYNDESGKSVFITFDENVNEDRVIIDSVKKMSEVQKNEVLTNPELYFRQTQLEGFKLEEALSNRITGFVFGKPEGDDWAIEKNGHSWNAGFEGESLFLRSKEGFLTNIDLNSIPEFYPEIVSKIEHALTELNDEELLQKLQDDDFLTPIPQFKDKLIKISNLEGEYSLDSLEQLAKRIEVENRPELDQINIDDAKDALGSHLSSDLIQWEDSVIPYNSLKRAVQKYEKKNREKEKIESVSFKLNEYADDLQVDLTLVKNESYRPPHLVSLYELESHQEVGFNWLVDIWKSDFVGGRKGALLADDMGLGKTLQVISLISYVKNLEEFSNKPILIVAPLSLLEGAWIEEGIERFLEKEHISKKLDARFKILNLKDIKTNFPKIEIYREAILLNQQMQSNGLAFADLKLSEDLSQYLESFKSIVGNNVLITSYETLRSKIFEVSFIDFSLVILDEAQKIKNSNSLQNRAVRGLKSDMNIAMTGTPIENGLMDLWNLMDFVYPMKLGTKKQFKDEFMNQVKTAEPGTTARSFLRKRLEEKLKPFWLRRLKSEVLVGDKALKTITYFDSIQDGSSLINKHAVVMSNQQQELYRQKMSIFNSSSKGDRLSIIRQLLEICSAPWLAFGESISYENFDNLFKLSPKLGVTFEILDSIFKNNDEDGRKVIIFANIIQIQTSLAYMIREWAKYKYNTKIEVEVYNGQETDLKKRNDILKRFEDAQGFKVLIISPRAGGAGLNIQCANHVIHYTREWNPALENQATARCYRIGQKRPVFVYYPTSIGPGDWQTAEENLANVLRAKRELMDDFTIANSEFEVSPEDFVKKSDDQQNFRITFSDLNVITPKDFEKVISIIYKRNGYESQVVGGAHDRGADIICFGKNDNILIQVKQKRESLKNLNTAAILEIRGAKAHYEHQHGKSFNLVVATNGDYSSLAHLAVAQGGNDVLLLNGTWIAQQLVKHNIYFHELR